MSEATSEHSAQPVTAPGGWRHLQHALARTIPARLGKAQAARRGLRNLARKH